MLREVCHLASENVDEAVKLENKGLIAELVCVSVPLTVGVSLAVGAGRSSLPSAEEGSGVGTELSFIEHLLTMGGFTSGAATAQLLCFK